MTVEEFVEKVKRSVVDENIQTYRELFNEMSLSDATDQYWQTALRFFHTLKREEQGVLFQIIRQVSIDTVSNLFGVLDGVSSLDGSFESFKLIHGDSQINGDLQDIFIELIEGSS